jgi:hypothetical protein
LLWIAADSEILPRIGRDLNLTAINIDNQIGQAASIFRQLRFPKSSRLCRHNVRIHRAAMNEVSSSSRLAPRLRCNGLLWIAADSQMLPCIGRDLNLIAVNIGGQIGQATDIFHQLRSQKSSKAVQT